MRIKAWIQRHLPNPLEWGIALILIGLVCHACAANKFAQAGSWRWLFVRNGLPDSVVVSVASPASARIVVLRVGPADSTCVRLPFLDTRAILSVQAKGQIETREIDARVPGLDWLTIGDLPHAQPAVAACLALAAGRKS